MDKLLLLDPKPGDLSKIRFIIDRTGECCIISPKNFGKRWNANLTWCSWFLRNIFKYDIYYKIYGGTARQFQIFKP